MHDPTDEDKIQAELADVQAFARAAAANRLMLFWPRDELPRRGSDGVLRHGYGRAVERSPQPIEVSRMALELDMEHVSSVLEARVFSLFVSQPECKHKVELLYCVADILGVDYVRDMDEVWTAANLGRWDLVSLYLSVLHWSAVDKDQVDRRMAAMQLCFALRDELH